MASRDLRGPACGAKSILMLREPGGGRCSAAGLPWNCSLAWGIGCPAQGSIARLVWIAARFPSRRPLATATPSLLIALLSAGFIPLRSATAAVRNRFLGDAQAYVLQPVHRMRLRCLLRWRG